jgi:hypothetical protein
MVIDTSFDFRTDAGGKDPDAYSRTLRRYHTALWSKPLPDGRLFDLHDTVRGAYLHHRSELGEFYLSSDSVIPTFTRWGFAASHPELVPEDESKAFMALSYTIGGMIVFPGTAIGRKWTINQARGCLRKISDRFDLTLECIRRYYAGQASPLGETLARYRDFFALFGNFSGYVEFFLLQDLVFEDRDAVKVSPPFDDFKTTPVPADLETYREYRRRSVEFVAARNRRIEQFAAASRSTSLGRSPASSRVPR